MFDFGSTRIVGTTSTVPMNSIKVKNRITARRKVFPFIFGTAYILNAKPMIKRLKKNMNQINSDKSQK